VSQSLSKSLEATRLLLQAFTIGPRESVEHDRETAGGRGREEQRRVPRGAVEDDLLSQVPGVGEARQAVLRVLPQRAERLPDEVRGGAGLAVERVRGGHREPHQRHEEEQGGCGRERRRRHQVPRHEDIRVDHAGDAEGQGHRRQGRVRDDTAAHADSFPMSAQPPDILRHKFLPDGTYARIHV
jgi:hypothetical protein